MPSKMLKDGRAYALQAKERITGAWVPSSYVNHPALVADAFHPDNPIYQNTIFTRDVSEMPLHPNSAGMAEWMHKNSPDPWGTAWVKGQKGGGWGAKTALNTSASGTQPIAAYVVDSTHPATEYAWMECKSDGMSTVGWDATPTPQGPKGPVAVQKILSGLIPLPTGALPAQNGDRGMSLYDIGTGVWREYFDVHGPLPDRKGPNGEPVYTAGVGGFSVNDPGRDISRTNPAAQTQSGQSAVVCMHNSLGFIHPDEVRAGKINHALAFTFGAVAATSADYDSQGRVIRLHGTPSWPAAASDAKAPPSEAPNSPTHGQWGRVRKDVDPMHNPLTGLPYNPLTRMLIVAAQKYGIVGTDTNAFVHAFNTHSGVPEMLATGKTVDPWAANGEIAKILNPEEPWKAFDISDFPWHLTEWGIRDLGRPLVDFYPSRAALNSNVDPYISPEYR